MVKKILHRKKKSAEKLPTRITNDTVAQHREKVLAGGRKLKYPMQYTRNKLVRNAVVISIVAVIVLSVAVWAQLYIFKDTSDLAQRITRVLPLPIAKIDGESVRYSNYLLYHRSTVAVLEGRTKTSSSTASDRMRFQRQQSINRAVEDAYAKKIARDKNITIADERVSEIVERQRKESGLSEEAYTSVIKDQLNWTMDEMREAMENTLLRQEVSFSIDSKAADLAHSVGDDLNKGASFADVAKKLEGKVEYRADVVVPKDNSDGGLSDAALKLDVGKKSGAIKLLEGDGYYFIMRQESGPDSVAYSYIKVPLTEFQKQLESLKSSGKLKVFVNLD